MMKTIYELIGEIFENAQYIEWNIALITCDEDDENANDMFEKMQNMTLGKIIGYAKEIVYFDDEDVIEELEYILKKRNYLAHQFFKRNDFVKHRNNTKFLDNKIRELQNILEQFQNFNNNLSAFYKEYCC